MAGEAEGNLRLGHHRIGEPDRGVGGVILDGAELELLAVEIPALVLLVMGPDSSPLVSARLLFFRGQPRLAAEAIVLGVVAKPGRGAFVIIGIVTLAAGHFARGVGGGAKRSVALSRYWHPTFPRSTQRLVQTAARIASLAFPRRTIGANRGVPTMMLIFLTRTGARVGHMLDDTTRFTRRILVTATMLAFAGLLPGQPTAIQRGSRVRIEGTRTIKGLYAGMREDSILVLRSDAQDTVPIALSSISGVAISKGHHGHAIKGLKLGLIAGAGAVLLADAVFGPPPLNNCVGPACPFIYTFTPVLTAAGAVAGGLIGGLVGALWRSEAWQAIQTPSFGMSLQPNSLRGVGVEIGIRRRF